jgi:AcrR family transcriptional regulator
VTISYSQPPTEKGVRQSEEILDAALRCLGRDGFSATSLSRVADEAGVSKRMVLYYFDSREALFERLAESIGDRLYSQLEDAVTGLTEPGEVVESGFNRIWAAITSDRALLIALFGVTIESVTDSTLSSTVIRFKDRFRDLLKKQMHDARAQGRKTFIDDEVAATLILSGFLGLAMEWLERGDSPQLTATIASYQAGIAALAPPA